LVEILFFEAASVGSLALWYLVGLDQRSYSTLGQVSAWMGDHFRPNKLYLYVTSRGAPNMPL